jgi:glutamate 5-kinase
VVVKIGSAVLAPGGELDVATVHRLAGEFAREMDAGRQLVVVSSGAVASGFRLLGLPGKPRTIVQKQAAAAIGQPRLMRAYTEGFAGASGARTTSQVLLTADDMDHRARVLNARRTLQELLECGVVPIINENDSVAFDEIKLGDNDNLSALVASLVQADALVILSTVHGLLDSAGKIVGLIGKPEDALPHVQQGTSSTGTGGMVTKVTAARTAGAAGVPTVIAGGAVAGNLARVLAGEDVGTFFVPRAKAAASRKRWIGFSARARGVVTVDEGAARAIRERGASLLPPGVRAVEGEFGAGALVEIRDGRGKAVARGIAAYSSQEISRLAGVKTGAIEATLGYAYAEEIVHRDNLALLE